MGTRVFSALVLLLCLVLSSPVRAEEPLRIAVAANFSSALEAIAREFEAQTGEAVSLSAGSSGALLAQIEQGAPFDGFFSADTRAPRRLQRSGLGDALFVYARGKLVLYSNRLPVNEQAEAILATDGFRFLTLANPDTAPYGRAAREVLEKRGLWRTLKAQQRIVTGESITQALHFVATDNAQLGFIAGSQVLDPNSPLKGRGYRWWPPADDYAPIEQAALSLSRSDRPASLARFMAFVRSDTARQIMAHYGYEPGGGQP